MAVRSFDASRSLDPTSFRFQGSRGLSLMVVGRYDDALASFDEAIARDPNDSWSHQGRAIVLGVIGGPALRDSDEAIRSAKRSCELTGEADARSLSVLAKVQARSGDFAEAAKTQQRAIDLLAKRSIDRGAYTMALDHYRSGGAGFEPPFLVLPSMRDSPPAPWEFLLDWL